MLRRLPAIVLAGALALWPTLAPEASGGVTGFAVHDRYTMNEDRLLKVAAPGILANDGPAEYPNRCVDLPYVNIEGLRGTLDIRADGSFDFRPNANFWGETTFAYKMGINQGSGCPEGGPSNDGVVTIVVRSANDAPTIVLDDVCDSRVTVVEDSAAFEDPGHCVQMTSFGPIDENNQGFDAWLVSSNRAGLFSRQPAIARVDGTFGRLSFTPKANATGTATVTVRGRDTGGTANGGDDTSTAVTFQIRITPTNDAPTAEPDQFTTTAGLKLEVGAPGLLSNDVDIDGDSLTAQKVGDPAHGTVSVRADGGFTYAPEPGFVGSDTFSYRATDGSASSATRLVSLTVVGPSGSTSPTAAPATPAGETLQPSEPAVAPSPAPAASAATTEPVSGDGGSPLLAIAALLLVVSLLAVGAGFYLRSRGVPGTDRGGSG